VEVKRALQKIEKDVADLSKAERPPQQEQGPKTFAQVASTPRTPVTPAKGPNHTLIVSSTNPQHTGDNAIERIRDALDLKATGARVDAVRKARNQKVVLRCASKTDLGLIKDQFKSSKGLKVQEPKPQNPLVCIRGVLTSYSDEEILDLLKAQNKHLLQNLAPADQTVRMRYRKRARNPHECHPVLELSPKMTPRKGTGVEMDLATREANNLLQKGKGALEAAGNMKRECKTATYECLQGLYETVLSLADSRARHKYNLERAHNRDVMALKAELSLMRTDLSDTKKEAKGIREWLGHETLDAFKGIK
ncbi:hypothetical protein HW555_007289, partial [Spodoptera exigua]